MKHRLVMIAIVLFVSINAHAQSTLQDPTPYFLSIIVNNIDSSIYWYQTNLGFELVSRVDMEDRGISQANLKLSGTLLELIGLKKSINSQQALQQEPSGTRLQGFFKFGFSVSQFDQWVNKLEASPVEFHGKVVTDPISGKKMVILKDPDGNSIQLFEH